MNWDRYLLPAYIAWVLLYAAIWPLAASDNAFLSLTFARYGVSLSFFVGALLNVAGLLRFVASFTDEIPAYLALLLVKSVTFFAMSLGFLMLALGGSGTDITPALLFFYYCVGMAAASKLFTGLYITVGAGRGWINRPLMKNPFARDTR